MMKGPVRELIPIGAQDVWLRLPEGAQVRRVRLLAADMSRPVRISEGVLSVHVPGILDHEVIAVGLSVDP